MKDVIDSSNLSPPEDKLKIIKKEVNDLLIIIKNVLRKEKIKAEIFVGGSYAKQTLMRKDNYDRRMCI